MNNQDLNLTFKIKPNSNLEIVFKKNKIPTASSGK